MRNDGWCQVARLRAFVFASQGILIGALALLSVSLKSFLFRLLFVDFAHKSCLHAFLSDSNASFDTHYYYLHCIHYEPRHALDGNRASKKGQTVSVVTTVRAHDA